MKRALGGARPVYNMDGTRSTSLEVAKNTDSSEEELQRLVEPTEQKNPIAAFHLNVQGETTNSVAVSRAKSVRVESHSFLGEIYTLCRGWRSRRRSATSPSHVPIAGFPQVAAGCSPLV